MVLRRLRKKAPLIDENRRYFSKFDHNGSLRDATFAVFDTEMTGLDPRSDEIVSLGAVKIHNLQIDLSETFHEHIQPGRLAHTEATLIHRITPEQLKQAPVLEEVMPRFIDFLGTSLLVGHCIGIDMDFLDRACRMLYGGKLANPTIDTMLLSRAYRRKLHGFYHDQGAGGESYNLHDLSSTFCLPVFERHNAMEDAMQAAYLFLFIVKKFCSGGLETLKDLYQAGREGTSAGGL
jgi:DNA polymerase-3 subunit epsilon